MYHGTGEGQFEEVGLCGGVESNLGRCAVKSLGNGPGFRLEGSLTEASADGFVLLLLLEKFIIILKNSYKLCYLLVPGDPTKSISASSTIILLSILNGFPNIC